MNQLEIVVHVEHQGILIRADAVRTMKVALAGTATTKFLDVMEAVFGVSENPEDVPELMPTTEGEDINLDEAYDTKGDVEQGAVGGAQAETPEERITRLVTSLKRKVDPTGGLPGAGKRKTTVPVKNKSADKVKGQAKGGARRGGGKCPLSEATPIFPAKKDK